MELMIWCIIAVYAVVVAGWWFRHVLISLARPAGLVIEVAPELHPAARISAVIAAKNERLRIQPCIDSLRAQGPVVDEIIVVDDRSDDGTGEFVREIAEGDPRVRVVRVGKLPPGWAGKAHACHVGGQAARSEWLVFSDADCTFLPNGLASAVRHAEQHDAEFLTLWLRADHRSFWEHMLIPLCGALILYWFPPFRANRPRSHVAYATGQFILIRRDAYERIGGHESSRAGVIEDIPLAQHAKRAGLRMRTALGADVVSVRMYTCYREIRDGWTRIFIGALQRPWKLLWSVWSLYGGSLLPSIGAPVAAGFVFAHGWPETQAVQVAVLLLWAHFIAVYTVSFRSWGLCRCDRRYLLLYPISCVVVIEILVRGWWWMVTKTPVIWRGSVTGSRPGSSGP